MRSRTATGYVELATDSTASERTAQTGVHVPETANEGDKLASLVRNTGIDAPSRQEALEVRRATQCDDTRRLPVGEDVLSPDKESRAVEIRESTKA